MQRSRKTFLISAGLAAAAIAAALLLYGNFRRSDDGACLRRAGTALRFACWSADAGLFGSRCRARSSFYQHRPDKGPIAVPNQDYADFVRSTGFDFEKDLDRVVIASWPAAPAKSQEKILRSPMAVLTGRKFATTPLRKGKLDHQQGHEVFLFPTGDRLGFNSIIFLNDHRIALVGGPSIAPLFAGHGR